jgi:ribonuclease-3
MTHRLQLNTLEGLVGHHFSHPELLERALTHSSHANELADANGDSPELLDNESLEFLGDAVLGFVTSRALFERYPDFREGQLSKARAHLVSARHLIQVAKEIGLGDYLRLGRGEERSGGRHKSAILVDGLEALIAAIYLDGGLPPARKFILRRIVEPELKRLDEDPQSLLVHSDQKSALQELLQGFGQPQPSYHVVQEEGPDHQKMFTVEVRVRTPDGLRELSRRGAGRTKKIAEQRAAQLALESLKQETGNPRT